MPDDLTIRPAESDADLEAFSRIRRLVVPNESAPTVEQLRAEESPVRLLVLAESHGTPVGSGVADRSQIRGAFVAPRVLEAHRRRGVGTAILRDLLDHARRHGFDSARGDVVDDGSLAFAIGLGFREIDRQVEQVRIIRPDEPAPPPYSGVEFTTCAARPELLALAYPVASQGYADMVLAEGPANVSLEEWLRDEASLPAGSFVALADGRIVGYAGLIAWNGDETLAENGLTVVDRAWRGRGLGAALKRRQLAWAATNGIREIVTWTQQGNEAMQHLNARLGYTTRSISRTMQRDQP
jgi:GNAT superfamily N-acetyltransferase